MPIYEYRCDDCAAEFEKFVRSVSSSVEVKCPECGSTHVKKGWSVFGTGGGNGSSLADYSSAAASCSPGGT